MREPRPHRALARVASPVAAAILAVVALECVALAALASWLLYLRLLASGALRPALRWGAMGVALVVLGLATWRLVVFAARRRFQFRLRTLLASFVIVSLALAVLTECLDRLHERRAYRQALFLVHQRGGTMTVDNLRNLPLPDLWELPSVSVEFVGANLTDEDMRRLSGMTNLGMLHLVNTTVSEDGLMELAGLPAFCFLILENPDVDPSLIERLERALPNCRVVGRYADLTERRDVESAP